MLQGSFRLSILAGALAFGATGLTLALMGLGLPYGPAALLPGLAAGVVLYAALRGQPPPDRSAEHALRQELEDYRAHSATLRHDLRGVLSPALMMSDRLLNHPEPTVQRAGTAVVRSIERATALLNDSKGVMAPKPGDPAATPAPPT